MAKRIVINVDVNADKAEKTLGQLNKDGQTIVSTLGDMREAASRLEQQLEDVEVGSKAYKDLRSELVRVNKEIKNQELAFESLDSEGQASSLKSVAGGFADVAGGIALVAGSNEDLEKLVQTIAQVEGATKIVTGSMEAWADGMKLIRNSGDLFNKTLLKQAIATGEATTAQRIMNAVLNASPIFIILGVIGAVAAAWLLFSDNVTRAEKQQALLNDAMKAANAEVAKEQASLTSLLLVLQDTTASETARKEAIENINEIMPDYLGNITEENLKTGEGITIIKEYIKTIQEKATAQALESKLQQAINDQLDATIDLKQALREGDVFDAIDAKERLQNAQEEIQLTQQLLLGYQNQQLELESANEDREAYNALGRGSNDIAREGTNLTEDNTKSIKGNTEALKENIVELEKIQFLGIAETLGLFGDHWSRISSNISLSTKELIEFNDEMDEFTDSFEIIPEDDVFEDAINKYSDFFGRVEGASAESNAKQVADWVETQDKKLDTISNFNNAAGSLAKNLFEITNNLGKQDEESQKKRAKRQFNIQKGLDIVTAGIDGAKAIVKGIAEFGPPPSPLGIAAIASAGIITATQIAAIASKQFNPGSSGGASGGGSSAAPATFGNASQGSANTAAPNNVALFGTAGSDQSQTVGGSGSSDGSGQHAPIVIENHISSVEMTKSQNTLSNAQTRASIGL